MSAQSDSRLYPASVSSPQAPPQAAGLSTAHGGGLCGAGAGACRQDGCHGNMYTDGSLQAACTHADMAAAIADNRLRYAPVLWPSAPGLQISRWFRDKQQLTCPAAPCRCKQSCRGTQIGLLLSWSSCTSTRHACCQAGRSLSRCAEKTQAPPCLSPQRHPDWQETHPLTGHSSGLTTQGTVLSWWDLPKHLWPIPSAAGQKDLQGPSRVAAGLQRVHVSFTPASRRWLRRGM